MPAHIGSRDDEAFGRLVEALAQARRDGRAFGDAWPEAIAGADFTDPGVVALNATRPVWARAFHGTVTPADVALSVVGERFDA
jgi:hypothetical protein